MPTIECLLGPAQTPVGGDTYNFERNEKGHYVAEVASDRHARILTDAGTYVVYDPNKPAAAAPKSPKMPLAPQIEQQKTPLEILTADLLLATQPRLVAHGGKLYVGEPWPKLVKADKPFVAAGQPWFDLDGASNMRITVTNGQAFYSYRGDVGADMLWELNPDNASYEPIPLSVLNPDGADTLDGSEGGEQETQPAGDATDTLSGGGGADALTPPPAPPLITIVGIGPGMVKALAKEGIETIEQLLALDEAGRKALDDKLKAAPTKGKWFEQAVELTKPKA